MNPKTLIGALAHREDWTDLAALSFVQKPLLDSRLFAVLDLCIQSIRCLPNPELSMVIAQIALRVMRDFPMVGLLVNEAIEIGALDVDETAAMDLNDRSRQISRDISVCDSGLADIAYSKYYWHDTHDSDESPVHELRRSAGLGNVFAIFDLSEHELNVEENQDKYIRLAVEAAKKGHRFAALRLVERASAQLTTSDRVSDAALIALQHLASMGDPVCGLDLALLSEPHRYVAYLSAANGNRQAAHVISSDMRFCRDATPEVCATLGEEISNLNVLHRYRQFAALCFFRRVIVSEKFQAR